MSTNTMRDTSTNGRQTNWSLAGTVVGVFAVWGIMQWVFFDGLRGSDDFHYIRFA